jgi:ubiquinone/menaquinone biosynthesis C-methylase UbiE
MNNKKFKNYELIASIFDQIQDSSKYKSYNVFIRRIWKNLEFYPKTLLDLGCGSGSGFMPFLNDIEISGIDNSDIMLKLAKKRLKKSNKKATLFKQSFLDYKLKEGFDSVICVNFTANHILTKSDFLKFLNSTYKSLNENGVFVFDIKPKKDFIRIFSKRSKFQKLKGLEYKWEVDSDKEILNLFHITLYIKQNNQVLTEQYLDKVYSLKEIKEFISKTKFKLLGVYDNYTFNKPTVNSKLWTFVLRK